MLTGTDRCGWLRGYGLLADLPAANTAPVVNSLAWLAPEAYVAETPADAREVVMERAAFGKHVLALRYVGQSGARPGRPPEHQDLMKCRGLQTFGILDRMRVELMWALAEWATTRGEGTGWATRRANRECRAFVMECQGPVDKEARRR